MDLIGINNQLKQMSDPQLAQSLRDPSIPPYLVISEMNQRNQMRQAYMQNQEPTNQPSVAQRVMGQFSQGAQQGRPPGPGAPSGGIMGGPSQQQTMGAFGRPSPPIPGSSPMRSGGVIGLLPGGPVPTGDDAGDSVPPRESDPAPDWSVLAPTEASLQALPTTVEEYRKIHPEPNSEDAMKWVQALRKMEGSDYITPISKKVAELEERMRGQKPQNVLTALGLGIAASRNPTFAGAVGEGGLAALQRYDQEKQQNQKTAMDLLAAQAELARAQQQREEQRMHNALGAWDRQTAERNVMESEIGANVRARLNAIQSGKMKVADLQERYRESMAKLNEPITPDTPAKLTWIGSYDSDPRRREAAKEALASLKAYEVSVAAAKKGSMADQQFLNPGTPQLPKGWASSDGKAMPQ